LLSGQGADRRGGLDNWADAITEIAAAAKTHGKGFAYLISPSKPAHLPQYLPVGLTCPALARGGPGDKSLRSARR